MKCPLRKETTVMKDNEGGKVFEEDFMNCMGYVCAWYNNESKNCSIKIIGSKNYEI